MTYTSEQLKSLEREAVRDLQNALAKLDILSEQANEEQADGIEWHSMTLMTAANALAGMFNLEFQPPIDWRGEITAAYVRLRDDYADDALELLRQHHDPAWLDEAEREWADDLFDIIDEDESEDTDGND